MYLSIIATSIFLYLYAAGCTTTQKPSMPTEVRIKGVPATFEIGAIVRPETAEVVSFDQLLADLENVQVVYIGEVHTNEAHHDIQLKVLKVLFERCGNLLVGMEMFEASYQDALDQWSAGMLDEASFLGEVGWENTWRFDFGLYRPILDFVRMESLKVVCLNVPGPIVEKVAREGLESLSDEEWSEIARDIDTSHEGHRAYVKDVFEIHESEEITEFEFFYEAQCVWDDSMARAIAQALNTNRMVVLAGNGHIAYKFGIPDRAYRRTHAPFRTIMPVAVGTEVEPDVADYIWVTPLHMPRRAVVGIRLKTTKEGGGLLIEDVIEESPAALVGIKPQDILLAIDGMPVSSLIDVHKAMAGAKRAPTHVLKIERRGQIIELTIRLK